MKKLIYLLLSVLPVAAAAQKGYTINGKLQGLKEPATAYLAVVKDGAYRDKDSVQVQNGVFKFTGQLIEPGQAMIAIRRSQRPQRGADRDNLAFFLENSKISLTGKDSIHNAVIKGSQSDKEARELEVMIRPMTNTIIRLNGEFAKKPKQDPARQKASDTVTALVARIKETRLKFVENHLNSYMGLYTYNISILDSKFEPAKVEPLFHRFSSELKSSPLGQRTFEKIEIGKRRQAGAKVTDFTQKDLNDQPFTLSSLRGKYVLVDFWASWCGPCRAENPNVVKAYHALKDKGFEIVSVSLDQGKPAWENAVKTDGMPWIHVSDLKGWKNEVAVLFGINSVPQNILVNPQGVIVAKNLRGENLLQQLQAFIK